jgi:hypothetical protein
MMEAWLVVIENAHRAGFGSKGDAAAGPVVAGSPMDAGPPSRIYGTAAGVLHELQQARLTSPASCSERSGFPALENHR